jgi:hypothetical protein
MGAALLIFVAPDFRAETATLYGMRIRVTTRIASATTSSSCQRSRTRKRTRFPNGWHALKPYLRVTPDPRA